jgi:hypothetical protein
MRLVDSKRDEVTAVWRQLHNKKHHDFCSLPYTDEMIRSKEMTHAGHAAHMGHK